jgi:hypothetical protein
MAASEEKLRAVVEALAPLERRAGSADEHEAARWIAARLERAGCRDVAVEEELFHPGYARELMPLSVAATAAGLFALRGRAPRAAAAVSVLSAAAFVDDVSNGTRVWRRTTTRALPTWNVVAHCGDPTAVGTLVVLAHHDAAPTGLVFDQTLQREFVARFGGIAERMHTSPPFWWPTVIGPGLVVAGVALRRRALIAAGLAVNALLLALGIDIARSPVVPGANDNLSAVAALVGLAERLREEPLEGLRVMLVSCGAEEVLQGGIHGFAARHFPALDRERTWFLNLDTIGSPRLLLIEGEGPFVMEDYHDRRFRDRIARVADRQHLPLLRGIRSRASSDSVVPSRAGYPTAMLASMDRLRSLTNYHLMSDTPEHLSYGTIADAVGLAEGLARDLAAHGSGNG